MNAPEFQKLFQKSGDFHSNLLSKDAPKSAKRETGAENPTEEKVSSFSKQWEEIPHPAQSGLSEPKRESPSSVVSEKEGETDPNQKSVERSHLSLIHI